MSDAADSRDQDVDCNIWNYHPKVPIPTGGVFRNILNPVAVLKGIALSWFGVYVRGIFLAIVAGLWFTVFPGMETIAAGGPGWVLHIAAINFVLMLAWAGGLHLHFYTFAKQGKFLRFSMNAMEAGPKFAFGHQVREQADEECGR